jgi:hypothetical protein
MNLPNPNRLACQHAANGVLKTKVRPKVTLTFHHSHLFLFKLAPKSNEPTFQVSFRFLWFPVYWFSSRQMISISFRISHFFLISCYSFSCWRYFFVNLWLILRHSHNEKESWDYNCCKSSPTQILFRYKLFLCFTPRFSGANESDYLASFSLFFSDWIMTLDRCKFVSALPYRHSRISLSYTWHTKPFLSISRYSFHYFYQYCK